MILLSNNNNNGRNNGKISAILKNHIIDIVFVLFCLLLMHEYNYYLSIMKVPIHDGAYYLLNAREWLAGEPLDEPYRPPLISWIIAGIWSVTDENWVIIRGLQAIFTVSAGIVLYLILRKHKGCLFAFGVSALSMINGTLFFFSTQIVTEGMALFFLVLTLYFLKKPQENYWFLAGIAIGLTFASRYPIILQALVIFIVESMINKNPKLIIKTISGMIPVIIIVVSIVYLKTGTFEMALSKDTSIGFLLSPFYLINSIDIWGFAFVLVPVAFLYKRTYSDTFNHSFIAWFIVSLLFWSASSENYQYRFTIQFTPAVYFLSILALENILKTSISTYPSMVYSQLRSLKTMYKYHISGKW